MFMGGSKNSSRKGSGQELSDGWGSGSTKRQVRRNLETDKQSKPGGGGLNPLTSPDPPLMLAY